MGRGLHQPAHRSRVAVVEGRHLGAEAVRPRLVLGHGVGSLVEHSGRPATERGGGQQVVEVLRWNKQNWGQRTCVKTSARYLLPLRPVLIEKTYLIGMATIAGPDPEEGLCRSWSPVRVRH
jgi:hypothetical protein